MDNKWELKAIVQKEGCDAVAITEILWDDSHDCSAAMDGYMLFRRDMRSRRGGSETTDWWQTEPDEPEFWTGDQEGHLYLELYQE